MGKPIVMGRKTWESIGRALPGRQNIVVSRNSMFTAEDCECAGSLDEAIRLSVGGEVMVIGGGELYQQAMQIADRMILTQVDSEPEADTWFPKWNNDEWQQISVRFEAGDERNPLSYRVVELIRETDSCETSRGPGTAHGPRA